MVFHSAQYFLLLAMVFLTCYFCPPRFRWLVFLLAGFGFYAALQAPHLIILIFSVAMVTFNLGRAIESCQDQNWKKWILTSGILFNLLILFGIRYYPVINSIGDGLLGFRLLRLGGNNAEFILSIGVSYYILQSISYLIDIFLGLEKAERHFGFFFLYLSFFPKLLQGPIERAGDLLPQLKASLPFNYENVRMGLVRFTWGLFKKVVVADRLAVFVDAVFNDVPAYDGITLVLAAYFYILQLYCDFSGYTDMALGSAKIFNIDLSPNFKNPFFAVSIADFWRRWHITFYRWILDYLFRPLQLIWRGWKKAGTALAIFVTFVISGIWHGPSWGYVIWGALHGMYLGSSMLLKPIQQKVHRFLGLGEGTWSRVYKMVVTFHLVCLAGIFFRANSVADGLLMVKNIIQNFGQIIFNLTHPATLINKTLIGWTSGHALVALTGLVLVLGFDLMDESGIDSTNFFKRPAWVRWTAYYLLVGSIIVFGLFKQSQFLYFRF